MRLIDHSNLGSIKINEEDKAETFMTHTTMTGGTIKINMDQIVGKGEFNLTGREEVDQDMNKIIEEEILKAILGYIRISEDIIAEQNIELIIGMIVRVEIEVGVNLDKGHFSRNNSSNNRRNGRSASNSRSRSGSRASINRDRIICCKCRMYYYFAKNCPTSNEEREIEQIQQM